MPYSIEIGMDLHKEFSVFSAQDSKGKLLGIQRLSNDPRNFDEYFHGISEGRDFRVTVESTRGLPWVIDYFDNRKIPYVVANPFLNRAIANVHCKNDKYDATILAQLTRTDLVAPCYVPTKKIRELRDLLSHRQKLVGISTQLKNKVHLILSKYNYQEPYAEIFGPKGKLWMGKLPFSDLHRLMLEENLELLNVLAPRILDLEKVIRKRTQGHPYAHLLQTIPGIGPLTAAVILSRVEDIGRFHHHVEKFIRYAGLSVNTRSSANKIHFGHMDKKSDKYLRSAFVEAAIEAKQKDPGLAAFYQYLMSVKGKGIARVAVARKLARSAFFVMLKGKPYRYRQIQPQWVSSDTR
jgi:transposase